MLLSLVQPVAVRRAVFCMVCSFPMLVLETMGNQIALAYSSIGLVIALYVVVRVSFCFPHEVEVRALMMLFLLFAVSDIVFRCLLNFSSGSNVSPRIFDCRNDFIVDSEVKCLVVF